MEGWISAFPDLHVERKNTVLAEDAVAVEVEFRGTHRGPLLGPAGMRIAPTNRSIVSRACYFARVRDGKLVEFSAHPDTAGLMMQLGVMPTA
jgi:predicted ester cyclase